MRSIRQWMGVAAVAAVAAGSVAWVHIARDERSFPHRAHEKLFPTCIGCHAGILTGLRQTTFPAPETCARCHNGIDEKAVVWAGPVRTASNLRFDHVAHEKHTSTDTDKLQCLRCHGQGDSLAARPWMVVRRAPPAECLSCHEHRATAHLASDARCETCHVPVTQAIALSDSAIADLPSPPSHSDPNWIAKHAPASASELAQCATCHARESCARCHVNAATLPSITSLASDTRIARFVRGRPPQYPVPASHLLPSFAQEHGALASSQTASCANCHAQASCRTCHLGSMGSGVIGKLPRPLPGSTAGVRLESEDRSMGGSLAQAVSETPMDTRRDVSTTAKRTQDTAIEGLTVAATDTQRPRRVFVHPAGFARAHGPPAASGQLNCAGCHQQRFCTSCHQGEGERRYHPFNFVSSHASSAYARETSCTSCHNTETFCRSCHQQSGIAGTSTSRTRGAAHGAQPLWLLQHGQAARQGLQSCAGCHQQTDCLRCHSTATQRVNPHGPDFDARRMAARNKLVCQYCHISDPLK